MSRIDTLDVEVAVRRLSELVTNARFIVTGRQLAAELDTLLERVSHRGCTILLSSGYGSTAAVLPADRTHGCWCSSWKLLPDGTWRQWRRGRWCRPVAGDVRVRP
jgi:hypothetical protein